MAIPHSGTSPLVLVAEDYGTIAMMLAEVIPFVVLTGHALSSPHDDAFSGVLWLTKPFGHEEIIGTVRALL